jgi:HlyD family secretion protein
MTRNAKRQRRLPWIAIAVLLAAAAGAAWSLWGRPPPRPPLLTVRVDRGDLERTVTATGQLRPVLLVEVGSQVSGIIAEITVDFNAEVREGEVLARLDTSTFEANLHQAQGEVDSAEAALELAQVEARRLELLVLQGLVPQADVDQARARLRQAEAALKIRKHALERARSELARCTIYSPIDGMVISRNVDVGQTVAASMTTPILFTIAQDLTRMHIHALVPEADIGGIRAGQRVRFSVDAFPHTFTGTVVQVRNQPIIEQHVVMYDTVIAVENSERLLKPGMTSTVVIVTDEKSDVLRVRNTALRARLPDVLRPTEPDARRDGGGDPTATGTWRTVYRLDGGEPAGALEAVAVRASMSDGIWTEVHEGLAEGDLLATGVDLEAQAQQRGRPGVFGPGPAQF